jgi:hypothetical protein
MSRSIAFALAAWLIPAAASASDLGARMAGVYVAHDAQGADNILEIVPLSPRRAYLRLRTFWGNGHTCSAYGVVAVETRSLTYTGPREPIPCRLTLTSQNGRILIRTTALKDGASLQACLGACGARGLLDGEDRFRMNQRRPIHYEPRLRASPEYEAALAQDAGRIPESSVVAVSELPEVQAAEAFERERR